MFDEGRIIHGHNVNIAQRPHQVSVQIYGQHICGGSIIAKNLVLTAAHCTDKYKDYPSYFNIVAGTDKLDDPKKQKIGVLAIAQHQQYSARNQDFDVSILVLNGNIKLGSTAKVVQLNPRKTYAGQTVYVTGWGTMENGKLPNELKEVEVKIIDQNHCNNDLYVGQITQNMICAGFEDGYYDSCQVKIPFKTKNIFCNLKFIIIFRRVIVVAHWLIQATNLLV